MHNLQNKYQVIIVGGGPVGLFLGCCLQHNNISCLILEKERKPVSHSRSIGIHPVSLELFDELGMASRFVEQGIKIKKGIAISDKHLLGSVSFEACPRPFNFVLSLPQNLTEQNLQEHLLRLNNNMLIRDAEVTELDATSTSVNVTFKYKGREHTIEGDYLAGCDGKDSLVRQRVGIAFKGEPYPDTYIMGDFQDNTHFGSDAAIFLTKEGLVESFPLIENKRRWVLKTDLYTPEVQRNDMERLLMQRIGHDLAGVPHFMLSSFGVQRKIAETFFSGSIVLAGDAAHVVSPIGGQGMNLGWIDAWELSQVFKKIYSAPHINNNKALLNRYSKRQQKTARKVLRRAEMNTKLGRKTAIPFLRNTVVWFMLNTPLKKLMAQIFTMRKLR